MKNIFLSFLFIGTVLCAQSDTVVLNDLIITDVRLQKNKTQFVQELNDSVITQNVPMLSGLLNFNSPIFFKENGYGMVSSPSFRGTTASQTAVVWNGIRINSGLLGQTDFNAISASGYDEIKVKSGGGSTAHGSGAIGGSVHLNHQLKFKQGFKARLLAGYGSYNMLKMNGKINYSDDKWTYHLGYNRLSSDNDYEVQKLNYKNLNGQFYNQTLNLNIGRKFNEYNKISLFLENFEDERHFSLSFPTENPTKYQNQNLRSLLQYENIANRLESVFRLSFIDENWKYWYDLEQNDPSFGKLTSVIAKYDGTYAMNDKYLTLMGEIILDNASGQNVEQVTKQSGNVGLTFSHQAGQMFYYEIGLRKEMNKSYNSPLLFSFGSEFKAAAWYKLKLNISRNFRAPTFNDLYWTEEQNTDLKAESALQFELSNKFTLTAGQIGLNIYLNDIIDMIRWMPASSGLWIPVNEDEVRNYGFEVFSEFKKSFGKHTFRLNNSYAYTVSKNKVTNTQLSYVPVHKLNGTFTHQYRHFSWYIQGLAVGKVFTTTDENEDYRVNPYQVFNLGLNYETGKDYLLNCGIYTQNIFNQSYETNLNRVMPPRNYGIQFQLKFN